MKALLLSASIVAAWVATLMIVLIPAAIYIKVVYG